MTEPKLVVTDERMSLPWACPNALMSLTPVINNINNREIGVLLAEGNIRWLFGLHILVCVKKVGRLAFSQSVATLKADQKI